MSFAGQMPRDWDDHTGWDRYYRELREGKHHFENMNIKFDVMESLQFSSLSSESEKTKVWVAGCGASIATHVFAAVGYEVWATDVSAEAIQIQSELATVQLADYIDATKWEQLLAAKKNDGELHLQVHDFRDAFEISNFDYIINIKSFQALPPSSMQAAASTFYNALAPKGLAIFSTMNVQGERRDWIENALVRAGFLVPFYEIEQWYRKILFDTGIPHIFILGNPMLMRGDSRYQGDEGKDRAEKDQLLLRSFGEERKARMTEQREGLQTLIDTSDNLKIASVIYNTG